jgi:ubiquinone/menaquinone biosynthesis C-methylase UbiE
MGSISFERIADRYDETRGGDARGEVAAEALAPWCQSPVLEVGIGTGTVALGLRRLGRVVVGGDLSPAMLERAQRRLGSSVVVFDGTCLPHPDGSVATVLFSWVLQLVDDPGLLLAEASRVLGPGGRVIVLRAESISSPNDIDRVTKPMFEQLRAAPDRPSHLAELCHGRGLRLTFTGLTEAQPSDVSPAEMAVLISERVWSSMWDLDTDRWNDVVEPVLRQVRALPDQTRRRRRASRHEFVVLERT